MECLNDSERIEFGVIMAVISSVLLAALMFCAIERGPVPYGITYTNQWSVDTSWTGGWK